MNDPNVKLLLGVFLSILVAASASVLILALWGDMGGDPAKVMQTVFIAAAAYYVIVDIRGGE
jgi:hypothetical protein